ncbi:cytochrome d ubiquinol oxidase subunit II [Pusillimonas sp. CC-YST705]|uniref:Cytochrome d ubiquinol oxidase subunit II n=1 Tax=Mesopusillimonas faecipullorum TaxID=2755040 RepID=A0ABS8C8Y6_9BURK|nr:cytochrome d ubiquinol oxidase subunit II [Mesopusillimonas faecipullorum]MCB5362489.1 cytochrome d ubiquinol oxidase subunit II [Mesopusillimonas faecipullorum]
MINTLVSLLGISAHDPAFWMPLVFFALLYTLLLACIVLDGFDIGVGCLALFASTPYRNRMLSLLAPWRDANGYWLLLCLVVFLAAFPLAWRSVLGQLYAPLCLLGAGIALRMAAFELRLRAPLSEQPFWARLFGVGSCMAALAYGWLLAYSVLPTHSGGGFAIFVVFVTFCGFASFCLLGACWLVMRQPGRLRVSAALWGRLAVRWAAAGAVAVSAALALGNPGVLLKWGGDVPWPMVLGLWGLLLLCFITLELTLRRLSYRRTAPAWLPFTLVLAVCLAVLGGIGYSFFPYLVLDDLTLWDASPMPDVAPFMLSALIVASPVIIVFNLWVYWRMFGESRPPEPPPFKSVR